MGRMYDLVVLEPTSSEVGLRIVEHVSEFLRKDIRWAVAGRDVVEMRECVEGLKRTKEMGRSIPAIELCATTKEDFQALARRTKVIINMLDIGEGRGELVVEACARNGTHYLDSASDIHWLGGMIRRYHHVARQNKSIILSHVSVESTPQDLLSLCAVMELKNKLNLQTREVVCTINDFPDQLPTSSSRPPSHRSLSSSSTTISPTPLKSPRHPPLNPWFLSHTQGQTCTASSLSTRASPRRELTLGLLSPSTTLSSQQTRVLVHRSWALLDSGRSYGEDFYYNEYREMRPCREGVREKMGLGWVKRLCCQEERRGQAVESSSSSFSSSEEKVDSGKTTLRAIAIAAQEGPFPDRALAEFSYGKSAAHLTAAFLAEGAATILYTKGLLRRVGGGGVLTPAVLGMDYLERLGRVGVEIRGELV
ncbi:hypothetical protein ONS95_011594 [Cadophora gregata]|uniref:uncharacterized protein n=1 Tax=Cadophora gregata TaxID=51156 RepID=UPI0026DD0F5A|nr:uncharacterized protein ONS95_011594 [Cadophora gregata]KAK0120188.1 hypothetical protein ONS95_011594 [Cadophora gregata]KAK0121218.1 hypothetical protein ONS96_011395 [Cadophora gregata f. sp. sojae]